MANTLTFADQSSIRAEVSMLLSDKTIFVIEDNLQNRIIFQIALTKHGARVLFEPWGSRALLQLNALKHVDVVILDLMLVGGISGFDIFDQIRAVPAFNDVPIIAVSAMDPVVGIAKTQAKGFAGFIAKPIDADLFPQQLATIVNGEKIWHVGERALS